MILLTRTNQDKEWLNFRLFEKMERVIDTTIYLTNGHVYIVKEKPEEINQLIIDFESKINYKCTGMKKGVSENEV